MRDTKNTTLCSGLKFIGCKQPRQGTEIVPMIHMFRVSLYEKKFIIDRTAFPYGHNL